MSTRTGRSLVENALAEADAGWAAAAAAGEVERILIFWAEDAVNLFPGGPPAVGEAAITKLVRSMRANADFTLNWHAENVCVAASEDLGYTSGPFEMRVPSGDGSLVSQKGNYLIVWKKDDKGNWKCAVDASVVVPAE